MTREEAIKIINCYDIGFYDLSGEKIPADKLVDAFDMAIEALEQEPRKGEWVAKSEHYRWMRKCSVYGWMQEIDTPKMRGWVYRYCPNCGAKMDGGKNE